AAETVRLRIHMAQEEERYKALDREQAAETERLLKLIADGRTEIDRQNRLATELFRRYGNDYEEAKSIQATVDERRKLVERLQKEMNDQQAKFLADRVRA